MQMISCKLCFVSQNLSITYMVGLLTQLQQQELSKHCLQFKKSTNSISRYTWNSSRKTLTAMFYDVTQ